jgi:hypothetical protein
MSLSSVIENRFYKKDKKFYNFAKNKAKPWVFYSEKIISDFFELNCKK